ncbi:MAG: RNA polymerase sigma factor [Candidatus Gastranaerophilales bacterium]|nr:RNA polymerase sigma factor [Candidatus Gastranaerophilales bacterium]
MAGESDYFPKEVHSDDALIARIRLGDEKAAEELIKRYYTPILRYCKRKCFNLEKAEDLTQETFLKLFKNLSGYQEKRKFKAYIYTIANHLCVDEGRKRREWSLENEEEIRDDCDKLRQIEDKSEIDSLLNVLSPEQREAVILRFGGELSFSEIAKVMGCNMRTAQSRVRSALKMMRKEWENER